MIGVVEFYSSEKGRLPTESEGLDFLVAEGYMKGRTPKHDPWGSEYVYQLNGCIVEIRSLGKNRELEENNGDDIYEIKLTSSRLTASLQLCG